MRVLLVMDSFFTGGAEFSTLEWFRFLQEKGIEIKIVKLQDKFPEYDYRVFGFPDAIITTLPQGNFFKKRKALQKILKEFQPDIVHSVLFKSNVLVRSIRMFANKFVHLESLVNHTYSKDRLKEPGITWVKLSGYQFLDAITCFLGTDHLHANGKSVADHYAKKLAVPFRKITIIHRGRKASDYLVNPVSRSNFDITDSKIVLLNVGRQEFQKGQEILLNSLSLLPKDILEKCVVLFVGREGKATPLLKELVAKNSWNSYVQFLGHRTDIPALLKMADIFVFPSRFEGLPGVLIEAEAAGLPIVCTNLPMMLEVVEKERNALVFEPENELELANQITKLVENKTLRNDFSEHSKRIFKDKFQLETIHQKMFSLYTNLLKK
jgi:glycosyltransferase involved in cell wall biosynthesis